MTEEKIVNRIRKMLALASDNAASEGERDNALRMAYNLMAKYNIDQSKVESVEEQERRVNYDITGWSMLWAVHIHNVIAPLFFCKYYRGRKINGTKLEHHFVGKESNAVTASYMATFIVTSVLKEGRANGWHNLSAEMRSFDLGVVHKLQERVTEIRKAAEQDSAGEPGTAIVLASLYKTELEANLAFLNNEGIGLKKAGHRGRAANNIGAYQAGQEFGGSINLNRQVSASGGHLQIGN